MTVGQNALINELFDLLPSNNADYYKEIVSFITTLGYNPHKQKVHDFVLAFKNKNNKLIAKIGIYKNDVRFRLKFHACRNVPAWCLKALWTEDFENEQANRFQKDKPKPLDNVKRPSGVITIQCTGSCKSCGGMRYWFKFDDGREINRCSAYPVEIMNLVEINMNELKGVILEQHEYFMSML